MRNTKQQIQVAGIDSMLQKLTILVGGVAINHFSGSTHSKISDHELEFLNLTLTQQIFIPHSIKLNWVSTFLLSANPNVLLAM